MQEEDTNTSGRQGVVLFKPLLADPKWPHFSVGYGNIHNHVDLRHGIRVSLGEIIPLFHFEDGRGGYYQIAIEGAVFSLFDMAAPSRDLVNTDFRVGLPVIYQRAGFSFMGRVLHQSSHLGDEFILRNRVEERVNLSYEAVEGLLSYEFDSGIRLYGGPGYMVRRSPHCLTPWLLQAGMEYRSLTTFLNGCIRPMLALDVQWGQEEVFEPSYSGRMGFQFERWDFLHRKFQIFFEAYHGGLPAGQLYEYNITSIGVGLHLYYD